MVKSNDRIILLDFLKILFAVFVFMRHSATMGGCTYPLLNTNYLVEINNVMMSAFFMISGFSLFYIYSKKDMSKISNCIDFYKKRAISILPIYFLLIFCHFIFLENDLMLNIKLFPLEVTGTHSFFDSLFDYLHNGTTWFISCLLLSYFLYPYLQQLVNYLNIRKRMCILLALLIFLTYLGFSFEWFNISFAYTNPLFRCFEFSFGIIICSLVKFSENSKYNKLYLFMFIFLLALMFIIIYFNILYLCLFLKYILLGLIIYVSSLYVYDKEKKYKFLQFLSKMTYSFYILQDLIWSKNEMLNRHIQSIDNNYLRIFIFFLILFVMSIFVTYVYQVKTNQYLNNNKS